MGEAMFRCSSFALVLSDFWRRRRFAQGRVRRTRRSVPLSGFFGVAYLVSKGRRKSYCGGRRCGMVLRPIVLLLEEYGPSDTGHLVSERGDGDVGMNALFEATEPRAKTVSISIRPK